MYCLTMKLAQTDVLPLYIIYGLEFIQLEMDSANKHIIWPALSISV